MIRRSHKTIAVPPGATIKEQLEDRGMLQKEFAVRMDLSEKHVSKLINGEVQLTPDVAARLETVLGVPAEFWNNLEAIYRSSIIKIETENQIENDEQIAKMLPYNEMARYGWVPKTDVLRERVVNLRSYFEIVKLDLLESSQITRICCRRLKTTDKSDLEVIAWAQHVKQEARGVETAPISMKGLSDTVPLIRSYTQKYPEEFVPLLIEDLRKCGVALIFAKHLSGSFLQGATFTDGNKIVIGMTTREKDADRFWFSLFHEIGHIILGHVKQAGGTTKEDEDAANVYARDILIPLEEIKSFEEKADYSEKSICNFAKNIGIAPGIVVGRLQNDRIFTHSKMNNLKEKYRIETAE